MLHSLLWKKVFLSTLSVFFLGWIMNGQTYDISGIVKDPTDSELSAATVYLSSAQDSTVIDYTITEDDGKFSLKGKTFEKEVDFYISYTGFENFHKRFSVMEEPELDLGTIKLKEMSNVLDEVLVKGSAPPIRLKKDTLEFNVSSFKTKENATLEDLLKKLPGVTVDNDGKIQVNGKDVSKIKVNGKDFFGDDPLIATKNLPKDILEKIQVVDTKSKSDEFTGRESDSEDKTINVTIREENNKGFFARMTAGAGTDHRFSLNGIGNYFKNDLRLSVLGSANNINSIGFSFDEVYDAMGRNAYSVMNSGGNSGITKSQSGGFDFVNSWGEEVDLSANYFFNRASTVTESEVQRENILPDRRYFSNSNATSKNVNNNHRSDFQLEYTPDTLTRISVSPNITYNKGFSESRSEAESMEEDGRLINTSTSEQQGEIESLNFSNRLDLTRRFGDLGGYYRIGFTNRNSNRKDDRSNYTSRDIYDDEGNLEDQDIQDQLIQSDQTSGNYTLDVGTRIPLSKKWKLDLDYSYTTQQDKNERLVYEADQVGVYDRLNEDLSSDFDFQSFQHRSRAGIVFRDEKLNAGVTGGMESTRLKNREKFTNTTFDNTYNNFFSNVYARYRIDQMKSIFFRYSNQRSLPSVNQLQPVSNTTNPLNIVTGNPNLRPALTNRFSLNFYNFNYRTHQGMFFYVRGNYNTDQIVSRTTTDKDLVRTTTYTNVDGPYNFNIGASAHKEFKFKNKSTLKPSINFNSSLDKNVGFSNGVRYHSNSYSIGPRTGLEYDMPDVVNVDLSYGINDVHRKYSLDSQGDRNFADQDVRLRVTSYWPKNLIFGNDITYNRLGETAPGFERDYVLWNMSLGYEIWDGDGLARIKVFDLLNQNVSNRRTTGEDYIQDTHQLVLKRYVMFSFTYKLSKFGGKRGAPSRGGGYRGGRFRNG